MAEVSEVPKAEQDNSSQVVLLAVLHFGPVVLVQLLQQHFGCRYAITGATYKQRK